MPEGEKLACSISKVRDEYSVLPAVMYHNWENMEHDYKINLKAPHRHGSYRCCPVDG